MNDIDLKRLNEMIKAPKYWDLNIIHFNSLNRVPELAIDFTTQVLPYLAISQSEVRKMQKYIKPKHWTEAYFDSLQEHQSVELCSKSIARDIFREHNISTCTWWKRTRWHRNCPDHLQINDFLDLFEKIPVFLVNDYTCRVILRQQGIGEDKKERLGIYLPNGSSYIEHQHPCIALSIDKITEISGWEDGASWMVAMVLVREFAQCLMDVDRDTTYNEDWGKCMQESIATSLTMKAFGLLKRYGKFYRHRKVSKTGKSDRTSFNGEGRFQYYKVEDISNFVNTYFGRQDRKYRLGLIKFGMTPYPLSRYVNKWVEYKPKLSDPNFRQHEKQEYYNHFRSLNYWDGSVLNDLLDKLFDSNHSIQQYPTMDFSKIDIKAGIEKCKKEYPITWKKLEELEKQELNTTKQ